MSLVAATPAWVSGLFALIGVIVGALVTAGLALFQRRTEEHGQVRAWILILQRHLQELSSLAALLARSEEPVAADVVARADRLWEQSAPLLARKLTAPQWYRLSDPYVMVDLIFGGETFNRSSYEELISTCASAQQILLELAKRYRPDARPYWAVNDDSRTY